MEEDRKLWREYRDAWDTYSRKNAVLQCLMDSVEPEKSCIEAAVLELENARVAHSVARDRLANHLSAKLPLRSAVSAQTDESRVRSTARLLWEVAGRPDGTAEGDWLSAEKLIRCGAGAAR